MSLRWSGDGQILGSAFGYSTGTLQSSHTLLSVDRSSRNIGTVFMHLLSAFVGASGCWWGEMLFICVGLLLL